nr:MAG TPA: hypothetical protein [Caudoviricetes sp.]
MKLVDVDPIIAAWKIVGIGKKNEAKPFLDSKTPSYTYKDKSEAPLEMCF